MTDAEDAGCSLMIVLLIGLVISIGFGIGNHVSWRAECIRRGAAHYDSRSGEFTWDHEPIVLPEKPK